jgi:hypothetical protein
MMDALRSESIHTWFDLGLFIDRLKEHRKVPSAEFCGSFQGFRQMIADGGIAFVTFEFGIDGIALQVEEYARAFQRILGNVPIHYVGGAFQAPRFERIDSSPPQYELEEIQGFDKWPLHGDFFQTKLERGSKRYNELIGEFWDQVLIITQKLAQYIEENGIRLLYLIDVCSSPGNVSLSLATVLVSEYLGIPVISRNRGFYWEEVSREGDSVFTNSHVGEFFSQIEVLFPWESRSWMNVNSSYDQSQHLIEMKGHNPANVAEIPPAADSEIIEKRLYNVLYRLHLQLAPNDADAAVVQDAIEEYGEMCRFHNEDLEAVLPTKNRHYLPGYGRTGFMLFLKSLIDPSYFRVEEQQTRGMVMRFAHELVEQNADPASVDVESLHRFYNAVDQVFLYHAGQVSIRHDHSLAYRHRNTLHYPYRDFTHQELTGLVNLLFHRVLAPASTPILDGDHHPLADWKSALAELTGGKNLAIDDRERLITRLRCNVPIAYFPGECGRDSLENLVLQPVRMRLRLDVGQKITEMRLKTYGESLAPVYIFCPEKPCRKRITADGLANYVASGEDTELSLLFKQGICKIIRTHQWCVGIHFPQLGDKALPVLREIQRQKGYIITDDWDAAVMTDIVDMDRFHIGRVNHVLPSKIMGIPLGSGYVQFVPAGLRATLSYPTPIQTAKHFHDVLNSPQYVSLSKRFGEAEVLQRIKEDAESRGSPLQAALASLESQGNAAKGRSTVDYSYLCGLYKDHQPWSGVVAKVNIRGSSKRWGFSILTGEGKAKKVTDFVQEFRAKHGKKPAVAWNGGFILNAELVGKLGLPESYIGSPLGLIISDGQVICPPLFNKPAFLVRADGRLDIRRVNCGQGLVIADDYHRFALNPTSRNPQEPAPDEICFYDLIWDEETIKGDGRIVVRLAGNVIKDVIHSARDQDVPTVPVGLTLSFPFNRFPDEWNRPGKSLRIEMQGWDRIQQAIEAGPMLVCQGKNGIDMEVEGWNTRNSIRTQAARMDYTNMRGPKIAIGLDGCGDLSVLAINGRIRESVGATHVDMAEILIGLGIEKAMGFDPGGSGTLVVGGKALNISPYNSNYESDVYSLPPEPRAVASAVVGYQE